MSHAAALKTAEADVGCGDGLQRCRASPVLVSGAWVHDCLRLLARWRQDDMARLSSEGHLTTELRLIPSLLYRQRLPPGQLNPSLQDRLNAPLGALNAARRPNGMGGLAPAQAALMRAGESAEELRMKEERQEQERAAQRKKETEAKRKAEVRSRDPAWISWGAYRALIDGIDHVQYHLQS